MKADDGDTDREVGHASRDAFDIIVIGAGHNGLVAANYLRRAGLTVLVVEQGARVGGNAGSTEPALIGFLHNPHANYLAYCDIMPMMRDFSLHERGLDLVYPVAQLGLAFCDGRPPVILHRPDALQQTVVSFGAYSKKDARVFAEIKRRSSNLGPLLRKGLYQSPTAEWFAEQRSAVGDLYGDMCGRNSMGSRTARQVIDDLFRTDEIRMLLYLLVTECGIALEEVGGDLAFFGFVLWIAGRWRLPRRGMQSASDAIYQSASAAGVVIHCSRRVHHVLVEGDQALGIVDEKGAVVRAAKAVVGAVPIPTLMCELLNSAALSHVEQSELCNFTQEQNAASIATTVFCLADRPRYKSSRHDAAINECFKTMIGYESCSEILRSNTENSAGLLPRPAGAIRVNTLWDPSQAPYGRHVAGVDSTFPAVSSMENKMWVSVQESYAQAFFGVWMKYTENLNPESVLGAHCDATARFERRMLLRLGDASYRTSVKKLYMCGPGTYPGGGVHGANAYNASRVLLRDLGLATNLGLK